MFSTFTHTRPQRRLTARGTGARVRRLALTLTAVICGLLVSASVPAFARDIPPEVSAGPTGPAAPAGGGVPAHPRTPVRLVTVNGLPGWEVACIAIGAAVFAAVVAIIAYRALASRRADQLTTA